MGKFLLVVTLGVLLAGSVWWAAAIWISLDAELSADGNIALVLGIVVSLVVGIGLMMLAFRSSRLGYDDNLTYEFGDGEEKPR
jgi:hypothetical protein